jgi:hypothetical protein
MLRRYHPAAFGPSPVVVTSTADLAQKDEVDFTDAPDEMGVGVS